MKKYFILAVIGIFCLALSLPAMADVKVGGMITMDWNYIDRDEARARGGVAPGVINLDNGFDDMSFDMPMPLTFMHVAYTSQDKVVTGLLRYRFGGFAAGSGNGANAINLYYAYINYAFSEAFSMRFGRQDTLLTPMTPSQYTGYAQWVHIVGIGFGNQNHTSLRDGITLEYKMSPMVTVQFGIFDNQTDNIDAPRLFGTGPGVPATALREENTLPRFDLAVPLTFGNFKVIPSFSWLTQEYDQVVPGSQDSVDCWAIGLSARIGFGPFSLEGEIFKGQNMDNPSYSGGGLIASSLRAYGDAAGNGQIEDSDDLGFFIQLSYKFGPATANLIYGQLNSDSDAATGLVPVGNYDITRKMYGISLPISVGGGFFVRPEIFHYDYDDSATINSATNIDNGKETIYAVIFMLAF